MDTEGEREVGKKENTRTTATHITHMTQVLNVKGGNLKKNKKKAS